MNKWSKSEKGLLFAVTLAAAVYVCGLDTKAMHIMEGYLPAGYCIAWGAVCLPFLAAGYLRIRKLVKEQKKALILLAMSGAFIFVISSLKIPSVTGSCSHMTGTGLGAILFGPSTVSILGIIVLVFQAVLLAHGGLTTLGANTFSMAIAGPLFSFGIYKLGIRCICPDAAAAGSAGGNPDGADRDRDGKLCGSGTSGDRIFQKGEDEWQSIRNQIKDWCAY